MNQDPIDPGIMLVWVGMCVFGSSFSLLLFAFLVYPELLEPAVTLLLLGVTLFVKGWVICTLEDG